MTLTRAAYRATITNLTRGWTRTVTAGDEPDPDAPTQLLDGLTMDWKARDGRAFAQLDPCAATFSIAALSIDELLPVDYDDEVKVLVERPTAGDPLLIGELGAPVATLALTTRGTPAADYATAVMTVTIIDPTSLLDTPITDNVPSPDQFSTFTLEQATARALALGSYPAAYSTAGAVGLYQKHRVIADKVPVREAVDTLHNGIRGDLPRTLPTLRVAHRWDGPTAGYEFVGAGPYRYFTDHWVLEALPLPLFTTVRTGRVVSVQRATGNDLQTPVHVLPASLLEDVADWSKSRRDGAETDITLIAPEYYPPDIDLSVSVNGATGPASPLAQRESIELMTGMVAGSLDNPGPTLQVYEALSRQLDARRPSLAWNLPGATVRSDVMTDAQWDHHCTRLFPRPLPTPGWLGRPLIVVDVAEKANPAGYASCYVVTGAKVTLQRGRVTALLDLQGRPLRQGAEAALTVNQVNGSSALAATTARDQEDSRPYIDPQATYDDLKLTTL